MINLILIGKGKGIDEILWIIEDINKAQNKFNLMGVVADSKKEGLLGNREWLIQNKKPLEKRYGKIYLAITIGNPQKRKMLYHSLRKYFEFVNIIHPSVIIHPTAKLGKGNVIARGCFISNDTIIGNNNTININVLIHHHCKIGSNCNISSMTGFMGGVKAGNTNFFGAATIAIPEVNIGSNNIFGAGAVIVNNFNNNKVIVGVPAKIIKVNSMENKIKNDK